MEIRIEVQVVQNSTSRTSALRRKICFRISFDVKKKLLGCLLCSGWAASSGIPKRSAVAAI